MCECYQIGGPFIAEDPECPVHGAAVVKEESRCEQELGWLHDELLAWRTHFPNHSYDIIEQKVVEN